MSTAIFFWYYGYHWWWTWTPFLEDAPWPSSSFASSNWLKLDEFVVCKLLPISLRITVLNLVSPVVVLRTFDWLLANFMKEGNLLPGAGESSTSNERRLTEAVTTTGMLQTIKETQFYEHERYNPASVNILEIIRWIYFTSTNAAIKTLAPPCLKM